MRKEKKPIIVDLTLDSGVNQVALTIFKALLRENSFEDACKALPVIMTKLEKDEN